MKDMVRQSLISVGVTRRDAVVTAAAAVVCLILLITFIILGVDAFTGSNNVSALLQSLAIFGVSRQTSRFRQQAASESSAFADAAAKDQQLVDTIVQRQRSLSSKL